MRYYESPEKTLINPRGLVNSHLGSLRGQVGVHQAKRQEAMVGRKIIPVRGSNKST